MNLIHGEDACCVLIYGYIGDYEDVRPADIVKDLIEAEGTGKPIDVRINSRGGDVYGGITVFNALRNSKADITIYIDGVAASMGSAVAMCEKPVYMSSIARLMIHSVKGGCYGGKDELLECVRETEALEATLISIYAKKTGKTEEEIRETYFDGKDHWLTAKEALALGFIDGIYDAEPVPAGSSPEQIYNIYQNRLNVEPKDNEMIDKLKTRKRFAACATDEDVLREVDKLETEAAKVPDLETANEALKQMNEAFKAAAQAAQDMGDEILLTESLGSGKIGALDTPVYRAALKGSEREKTLETLKGLPIKRRVMENIDTGGGGQTSDPWKARFDEIEKGIKD